MAKTSRAPKNIALFDAVVAAIRQPEYLVPADSFILVPFWRRDDIYVRIGNDGHTIGVTAPEVKVTRTDDLPLYFWNGDTKALKALAKRLNIHA